MKPSFPLLLGVLNVTPDSFSDGGKFLKVEAARLQAQHIVEAGADWLDLGGESTGPGSVEVSLEEELQRVLPVLEVIRADHPELTVSIDTWKAEVARRCLSMGAKVINDVTALRRDPAIAEVVAEAGVPIILMHAKEADGRTTRIVQHYDDVISTVKAFLRKESVGSRIMESRKNRSFWTRVWDSSSAPKLATALRSYVACLN